MHRGLVGRADGTRRAESQRRQRKIQPPPGEREPKQPLRAERCCGYARCGATNRPVFRPPETRRRAAAHEKPRQMRAPALLAFLGGATPEQQSRLKTCFLETATRTRRPALPFRSCLRCAAQSRGQMRGCTQGSLRGQPVFAIRPSRRPALRQSQERARPTPFRIRAKEATPC
jgi:hypothetical protein